MKFADYIQNEYIWPRISNAEILRLASVLSSHLRKMKISMNVKEREEFVIDLLRKQKDTCAFADGDDRFCWNEPKDKKLKYLKLQWGHKIPISHGSQAHNKDNLMLLCARCNNNIQKSRIINQLIPELEHKIASLKKIQLTLC